MLNALLQTIANLGFDGSAINDAFNSVLSTIRAGDLSSLSGIGNIFTGIISAFTGANVSDVSTILSTLINSMVEILGNASTTALLSNITGA